jgi:hypothetical protein
MTRPFMRHRIDDLEKLFQSSKGDVTTLRQLETELSFRQVPRAVTLLSQVRKVLASESVPTPSKQNDLFEHQAPVALQSPLWTRVATAPPEPAPTQSSPEMSIEEAYKALRVTPSSTWEAIENSRRQVVGRAHPAKLAAMNDRERSTVKLEAIRANVAYAAISKARTQ